MLFSFLLLKRERKEILKLRKLEIFSRFHDDSITGGDRRRLKKIGSHAVNPVFPHFTLNRHQNILQQIP
jgi:hypothetical protein